MAFESVMGFVHRMAMRIADLPKEKRAAALNAARNAIAEIAAEHGIKDRRLIELCSDGIEAVLREIESSGSSSGGHA
jgi:hypothetical protein